MIASLARLIPILLLLIVASSGCATRLVRTPIIDRTGVHVDLVETAKGFTTQPRGFEHPAIVSLPRITNILNAIEIERAGEKGGTIRQPAFHPGIVEETAKAIAEAMAKAGPDQELGFQIVRKEFQLAVLHQKYLTSFLAHIKDGYLYLTLNRVEWLVPKSKSRDRLPKPRPDQRPMNFRVVSGEHLFYAGPQTLEIDWQNPIFQTAYRLPGSTKGSTRRREILLKSPIPKEELDEANVAGEGVDLRDLSPEKLRALADLEQDRRDGMITEAAYQRARRQLLERR